MDMENTTIMLSTDLSYYAIATTRGGEILMLQPRAAFLEASELE